MSNLSTEKSAEKPRTSGRWAKGTSGNKAGRPPGSRNKATQLLQELLEGEAEQITRKAMDLALAGDLHAIRLCMERLLPARKDRPVDVELPPIRTVEQISLAMGTVSRAISDGQITPGEAETIAKVLAVQKDVIATTELERRLERLEEQIRIDFEDDRK